MRQQLCIHSGHDSCWAPLPALGLEVRNIDAHQAVALQSALTQPTTNNQQQLTASFSAAAASQVCILSSRSPAEFAILGVPFPASRRQDARGLDPSRFHQERGGRPALNAARRSVQYRISILFPLESIDSRYPSFFSRQRATAASHPFVIGFDQSCPWRSVNMVGEAVWTART